MIKPDRVTVVTKSVGRITARDIREMFSLPADAVISVEVPSGGDYSGETLDIGPDIPHLKVVWQQTKDESEPSA